MFSNKSEKVLVGYKEMHWFKQCPMDVVIPDSVATIADSAFSRSGLTSVVILDSVTTIGDSAFEGNCLDWRSISLPQAFQSHKALYRILGKEQRNNCQ